MKSEMHFVFVVLNTVIVALDVRVENLLWSLRVRFIFFPSFEHLLGAEIYKCQSSMRDRGL
jgi:hypothetical protein